MVLDDFLKAINMYYFHKNSNTIKLKIIKRDEVNQYGQVLGYILK